MKHYQPYTCFASNWRLACHMMHQRVVRAQYRWVKSALMFSWDGQNGEPIYPLRELMLHRLPHEWAFVQALGLQTDPYNEDNWRHRRTGQFSEWSSMYAMVFGDEWCDFAIKSSAQEWRAQEHNFVVKVCSLWGLPGWSAEMRTTIENPNFTYSIQTPDDGLGQERRQDLSSEKLTISTIGVCCPSCHLHCDATWPEGSQTWISIVDSRLLADWCSGRAKATLEYQTLVAPILEHMASLIREKQWLPKILSRDWVQWRPRAQNKEADALANAAIDKAGSLFYIAPRAMLRFSLGDVSPPNLERRRAPTQRD